MTQGVRQQKRKSKLASVEDALALIDDGMYIAFGGHVFWNKSSHMVRAIAKKGVKNLTISSSPYASYEIDLLVGVGAAKKVIGGNVGFEYLGLAPNFRKGVEQGTVESILGDEATIAGGYMASAEGIPYHPITSIKGSDLLKMTSLAEEYTGPNGEQLIAVWALNPDVAILHAQQSDPYGNARYTGQPWFDQLIAKASKKVIITVDEVISHDKISAEPEKTEIPGYLVEMVVHIPFGCHPCMSAGKYAHDEACLQDYIERGRQNQKGNSAPFDEYIRKYVYEPKDIWDYIDRVGGFRRMAELQVTMELGKEA